MTQKKEKRRSLLSDIALIFLVILLALMFYPELRKEYLREDYNDYSDQLAVLETELFKEKTANISEDTSNAILEVDPFAVDQPVDDFIDNFVIGKIENNTPYNWTLILFEVSFYDKNNRLVDTIQRSTSDLFPANKQTAFRVNLYGSPKRDYDRYEIKIIDAVHKFRNE